ncbi:MAG: LamG domain-containing protein [Bacteroidales bacterium]|nr:LamG domain-containing protein [Bacteroidales bacterium]
MIFNNNFKSSLYSIVLIIVILLISCETDLIESPMQLSSKIELSNITVNNISYRSAIAATEIHETYGIQIEQHGHCWSKNENPDVNDSICELGVLSSDSFQSNLPNLEPNSTYYINAYVKFGDIILYSESPVSITTVEIGLPAISTKEATNITAFTAEIGGEIIENNGGDIISQGVCWNKSGNPTTESNFYVDESNTESFTYNLTDLEYGQKYYVKAYAINEKGESYGNEIVFRTDTLASVNIIDISDITIVSATVTGNIANDGGASIISRGICYNNTGMPSIDDSVFYSGDGTGSFNIDIDNLHIDSTYYVRAFAINEAGISYGEETSFKTKNGIPSISTQAITVTSTVSATSGGSFIDDGGLPILQKGVCWSLSPTPTLNDWKTNDGSGAGAFSSQLINLVAESTYYVRAYAINDVDTFYGNELSFVAVFDPAIAYYPFNGNTNDYSENENHAINHGADLTSDRFGNPNSAYDFDGLNDYMQLTNTLDASNGLSFSFWVNSKGIQDGESGGTIICKYNMYYDNRCFTITSFNTTLGPELRGNFYASRYDTDYRDCAWSNMMTVDDIPSQWDAEKFDLLNPMELPLNSWAHCVINVTATEIQAWINGVLTVKKEREYTTYFNNDSEQTYIGNNFAIGEGGNNHFYGSLDELRVYNRPLTENEIQLLYHEGGWDE